MAEFQKHEEKVVNIGDSLIFENRTESAFEVSAGIIFHESGLYDVSVADSKTIVSRVQEKGYRNKSKVVANGNCIVCGKPLGGNRLFVCEECGAKLEDREIVHAWANGFESGLRCAMCGHLCQDECPIVNRDSSCQFMKGSGNVNTKV